MMFKKLFGTTINNEDEKTPSIPESLQKIKECEDLLIMKQEFLEKKIQKELNVAKSYGKENRRVALNALKKKKGYERELVRLDEILLTLHLQKQSLENAIINVNVLNALKDSSRALKHHHKSMDIEKIYDLMDEIDELNIISNDITMAISRPVGEKCNIDDKDLLKELEDLEKELLNDDVVKNAVKNPSKTNYKFPPVPIHNMEPKKDDKRKKSRDIENDFDDLKAWAES